jgi:hypothetical protein
VSAPARSNFFQRARVGRRTSRLLAPFPDVGLVPVSGFTLDNAAAYLRAELGELRRKQDSGSSRADHRCLDPSLTSLES